MRGSRLRWALALLPTTVQTPLGFEAGAPRGCDAGRAPVHGVSGASLGRSLSPPGVSAGVQRLGDTQRQRQPLLAHQEPRRVRPQCTPIGGGQREQEALRRLSPSLEAWAACLDAAYRGSMASLEQHFSKSVHMRFVHWTTRGRLDCTLARAASVPMLCGLI